MVMVQVWGVRMQGGAYFRKFFNFSGPTGFMKGINGFVGILELISECRGKELRPKTSLHANSRQISV